MIVFERNFKFLNVRYVYFAKKISIGNLFYPIEYSHTLLKKKVWGFKRIDLLSLQTSLTPSMEEVLMTFSSSCRNEIRRSIKEDVCCKVTKDIGRFVEFFNDFAKEKKINGITKEHLLSYGDRCIIFEATKDDRTLAFHSVLIDKEEEISVLMTSSNARFVDCNERKLISMANRHLHFYEMGYLKSIGICTYDYGGIASDEYLLKNPSLKGVNEFKKSFGGRVVDNIVYESPLFVVLRNIAKMFNIVKSNASLQKDKME